MKDKNRQTRTSLISIADTLKIARRMTGENEGGVKRLFLPDLEISISSEPAGELAGGDFHCIVHRNHGKTAIVIGDISGHDFASAIVATKVVDFIEEHDDSLMQPHLFLHKAAEELYEYLSSYGRFFTMAICVADIDNNMLSYASSGHPQSLLFSSEHNFVKKIGDKSLPIGFERNISFDIEQHYFLPGDIALLMTDGICSARSVRRDEFGTERVVKIVENLSGNHSRIVPEIKHQLKEFTGHSTILDDETIIVIART